MADQNFEDSHEENVDVLTIDAKALQALLSAGEITSLSLVRQYVAQIKKHDERLHAMIRITPNDLLEEAAKSLDEERAAGKTRGPLHGIPIIIKVCWSVRVCLDLAMLIYYLG